MGNTLFAINTISLEVFTCDEYRITRKTTALDVSDHGLNHSDASMMSGVLSGCGVPQLLDLNMACNNIGVKGAIALAKVIPRITVVSINLASNNLCGQYYLFGEGDFSGFFALSQAIHMASSKIHTIDISDNLLGPDGIAVFRDSVRTGARPLTSVSLARNDVAIPGSSVVAQLLQLENFSSITFLNLAHNDFGADGMRTISPHLQGMHQLVSLDLADNSVVEATDGTLDYTGVLALASVLGSVRAANASTIEFDKKERKASRGGGEEGGEGEGEGEGGGKAGARGGNGKKRRRRKVEEEAVNEHADKLYLHSLSLADNSIGAPGIAALAYALMVQEDITSLNLSGNLLGEMHWKPFTKHQEILQTAGVKGSGISILASLLKDRDGEWRGTCIAARATSTPLLLPPDPTPNACTLFYYSCAHTTLSTLRSLVLRSPVLRTSTFRSPFLSRFLAALSKLETLDLSRNDICDNKYENHNEHHKNTECLRRLVQAMKLKTPNISNLNLEANRLGLTGALQLAKYLAINCFPKLRVLDLSDNFIGQCIPCAHCKCLLSKHFSSEAGGAFKVQADGSGVTDSYKQCCDAEGYEPYQARISDAGFLLDSVKECGIKPLHLE
jgi:Ran GTPase-activating protein (RanGAP) involved in mRNA processing and transport